MTTQQFHEGMSKLLNRFCDTRAWGPLRVLLPAYPMAMGLTDEVSELARALKQLRVQFGTQLDPADFDLLVSLQHAVEDALDQQPSASQA